MKLIYTALCILCVSLKTHATDAKIFWRSLSDGSLRVQVQNWESQNAPELEVVSLNDPSQRFSVPTLHKMPVNGFYQLESWKAEKLPDSLYKFVFKGDELNVKKNSLIQNTTYQSIRGTLRHKEEKVTWKQTAPGAARLLFQMPSGLTLAASEQWQAYGAGVHELDWSSVSEQLGSYRYQPNLIASIQVAAFARDVLVIGKPVFESTQLPNSSLDCSLKLSRSQTTNKNLLKVELTPEALQSIGTKRFEILIYVDGLFVHEESQGVSPYTYVLPEALANSKSTLTVNIIDYLGNWGVASLPLGKE